MSLPQAVDVLVVGLGPAGASAARAAAAAGARVLAVDKARVVGEPVQCAEFIPRPMGGCAREPGVLVQRITGMRTFLPSGHVEASAFPGLMVDRAAFDRTLARAARAAGATLATGTRLVALDAAARDVLLLDAAGVRHAVRYGALVAADGPHSPVGAALGLPRLEVVWTRQHTVPLLEPHADTDIWLSDDFPGGYGWLFPKGTVANLGLGTDKRWQRDLRAPLERLHAALAAEGRVGREVLGRTGGAIPVGGLRRRLVEGAVLFAGDAAGLTHPITGAGIPAAVVSGEAAGAAAAAWLGGEAGALEDYEEDMRDRYGPTLARAVRRRRELACLWRTPAARRDAPLRRGWIAFPEYFDDTQDETGPAAAICG